MQVFPSELQDSPIGSKESKNRWLDEEKGKLNLVLLQKRLVSLLKLDYLPILSLFQSLKLLDP